MTYSEDEIARMTPWQREEAQLQLLREFNDHNSPRYRSWLAKRTGKLGGLAKAANANARKEDAA